jgi:hypothetical protein
MSIETSERLIEAGPIAAVCLLSLASPSLGIFFRRPLHVTFVVISKFTLIVSVKSQEILRPVAK